MAQAKEQCGRDEEGEAGSVEVRLALESGVRGGGVVRFCDRRRQQVCIGTDGVAPEIWVPTGV